MGLGDSIPYQVAFPITLLLSSLLLLWTGAQRGGVDPLNSNGSADVVSTLAQWWREASHRLPSPARVTTTTRCPVSYNRPTVADIRAHTTRPLLLYGKGGHCAACVGRRCEGSRTLISVGRQSVKAEGSASGAGQPPDSFQAFCSADNSGPTVCPSHGDALVDLLLTRRQYALLTATPCDVWPYLRGRAVWMFGDSQTLDLFKALVCALRDFRNPGGAGHDRALLNGSVHLPPFRNDDLSAVSANRTLVSFFSAHKVTAAEPVCIHLLQATRLCYIRYDRMEQMESQLHELARLVSAQDVSVVNFGLHHNAEQLAAGLVPLLRELQATPIGQNLYFKDTVAVHFDTRTGGYPMGTKPPFVCRALHGLELLPDGTLELEPGEGRNSATELFQKGNRRNLVTLPLLAQLNIPIVHTYNITAVLHAYHRDNGAGHECSHYCWPVPGIWVHSLLKTLTANPPIPAA